MTSNYLVLFPVLSEQDNRSIGVAAHKTFADDTAMAAKLVSSHFTARRPKRRAGSPVVIADYENTPKDWSHVVATPTITPDPEAPKRLLVTVGAHFVSASDAEEARTKGLAHTRKQFLGWAPLTASVVILPFEAIDKIQVDGGQIRQVGDIHWKRLTPLAHAAGSEIMDALNTMKAHMMELRESPHHKNRQRYLDVLDTKLERFRALLDKVIAVKSVQHEQYYLTHDAWFDLRWSIGVIGYSLSKLRETPGDNTEQARLEMIEKHIALVTELLDKMLSLEAEQSADVEICLTSAQEQLAPDTISKE